MDEDRGLRLRLVGDSLDAAEPAPDPPAPPADEGGGGRRVRWRDDGLPEGCPVEPLGQLGDLCYYLDASRQFRAIAADKHGRLLVQHLFGASSGRLYGWWPRYGKDGSTTGWRPELAAEALMRACAQRGLWNALEHVRGPGAWRGEAGELVLHCGDVIMICDQAGRRVVYAPGVVAGHVYPASAALPRPDGSDAARVAEGGQELLDLLATWQWRRGTLDARLLLGWIAAALLGGALDWRPVAWITGGRGTGKSTLHRLLRLLLGGALVQVSEASAAGIWQELRYATVPVAFDELEAEEDRRRADAVIKLARQAASGGLVLRGGQDHTSVKFVARSCFLFSSILIPPLLGQDRSRMAILELGDLPPGAAPPALDPERIGRLGVALRERLVVGWPRLEETLACWRGSLVAMGHSARGADQLGTLLAVGDLLLADGLPDGDTLAETLAPLAPSVLAEAQDDPPDGHMCLAHLLTSIVDPYRGGGRSTIGEWVETARRAVDPTDDKGAEAQKVLSTYGLRVIVERESLPARAAWLAVANHHQGLSALYRDSHWAGRSGSAGVWVQELRRLPGAARSPATIRFGSVPARATLLPIQLVMGEP